MSAADASLLVGGPALGSKVRSRNAVPGGKVLARNSGTASLPTPTPGACSYYLSTGSWFQGRNIEYLIVAPQLLLRGTFALRFRLKFF